MPSAVDSQFLSHFTLGRVFSVILLLVFTWLLIRYATQLLGVLSSRSPRARFAVKWFEPVMRISLWFTAMFLSFELLAPSRETFLAAIGSVAIAIGLGAQDLIKNLVGGLVVLADRPYQLGDRVKIGSAYGEIDQIGLRSTKLTTPDDTRVTIPNANILSDQVFNANSGVPDCQVVTDIHLPCNTDVEEAMRIGYEAAYTCPMLHLSKPVVVLVSTGFNQAPYLQLRVKSYVFDHRFEPRMQSDITARVLDYFQRRGALDHWPGARLTHASKSTSDPLPGSDSP